jgi:hypothetical protein
MCKWISITQLSEEVHEQLMILFLSGILTKCVCVQNMIFNFNVENLQLKYKTKLKSILYHMK